MPATRTIQLNDNVFSRRICWFTLLQGIFLPAGVLLERDNFYPIVYILLIPLTFCLAAALKLGSDTFFTSVFLVGIYYVLGIQFGMLINRFGSEDITAAIVFTDFVISQISLLGILFPKLISENKYVLSITALVVTATTFFARSALFEVLHIDVDPFAEAITDPTTTTVLCVLSSAGYVLSVLIRWLQAAYRIRDIEDSIAVSGGLLMLPINGIHWLMDRSMNPKTSDHRGTDPDL